MVHLGKGALSASKERSVWYKMVCLLVSQPDSVEGLQVRCLLCRLGGLRATTGIDKIMPTIYFY